jgi:hypothetical protein
MISTDDGIQIARSDEQFSNANRPNEQISQASSNAIIPRVAHVAKQREPIRSISLGRWTAGFQSEIEKWRAFPKIH